MVQIGSSHTGSGGGIQAVGSDRVNLGGSRIIKSASSISNRVANNAYWFGLGPI